MTLFGIIGSDQYAIQSRTLPTSQWHKTAAVISVLSFMVILQFQVPICFGFRMKAQVIDTPAGSTTYAM
jgi:uncharacterized SAM-binding protein YcdF (DUF218 family)